jgi:hypothetical protein
MKKPFHETTWSKVKLGDVALMAWASLDRIVEVEVVDRLAFPGLDGKTLVHVEFKFAGDLYSRTFDPEDTAYVQSRL